MTFVHKLTSSLWFWAALAVLLMLGLKTWLVAGGWVSFNSDEAVVALMARHILQGAHPIFFYGQAYMGSLDAFLVAGAFALLGQQVWAIRLVQILLYLGVLLTTAWLGRAAFGAWKVGVIAMLLLAVPTVNLTVYTTATLGGYGEALLLGNLILLTGLKIGRSISDLHRPGPLWAWLLLGFLTGLGLWTHGMTLVYSAPVMLCLLALVILKQPAPSQPPPDVSLSGQASTAVQQEPYSFPANSRSLNIFILPFLILAAGFFIGSAPWWGYGLENGFASLIFEQGSGTFVDGRPPPWLLQVGRRILGLGLLGMTAALGFRPPWEVCWLGLPVLPFVLFFWVGVVIFIVRCLSRPHPYRSSQALLASTILTLLLVFSLTRFGADPSGRYFLPLAIALSCFAAAMILALRERYGVIAYSLVALLLVYHLLGTVQSVLRFPPGITTQFTTASQVDQRALPDLISFLRQNGESRGYTNYWVTYPLAFQTQEELIFIPSLPYHLDFRHTGRDDRYPPYTEQVAQASRVAYITTHHPDLDAYLRRGFAAQDVTWREEQIGDFRVFYNLSSPLRPEQLGLDASLTP